MTSVKVILNVAVRHKDEELTYQQLMDESSKLAHLLQDNHR